MMAENSDRTVDEIAKAMLERTTLNPQQAKSWGLVHDIKSELFELGSEVISIQHQEHQTQEPQPQSRTRMRTHFEQ